MISLGYLPSIVVDRILSYAGASLASPRPRSPTPRLSATWDPYFALAATCRTLSHAAHSPAVLRALFVRRHGHRLALLEAARWWDAVGCPPWSSERFLLEWWQAFVGWDPGTPSAGTVLPVPRAVVQFLRKELEFEDRRREEHDPLLKWVGQPCRPRTWLPSSECAGKSAREFVVWLGREALYRGEVDGDEDDVAAVRKLLKDLVDDDFVVMDQLVYRHAGEHAQPHIHTDEDDSPDDPLAIFRAIMHWQTFALHEELHRHVVGLQFPSGLLEPSEAHELLSRAVWRFGRTCHGWLCDGLPEGERSDLDLPCERCAEALLREVVELQGPAGFARDTYYNSSGALPLALRAAAYLSHHSSAQFPRRPLFPASQFLLDCWWATREARSVQGLSLFRELLLDERQRAEVDQAVVLHQCVEQRIAPAVQWLRDRRAEVDAEEAVAFFLPAVIAGGGLDAMQRASKWQVGRALRAVRRFLLDVLGDPEARPALDPRSEDGASGKLLGFLAIEALREDRLTSAQLAGALEPLWEYFGRDERQALRQAAEQAIEAASRGVEEHAREAGVMGVAVRTLEVVSQAGAMASFVAFALMRMAGGYAGFAM